MKINRYIKKSEKHFFTIIVVIMMLAFCFTIMTQKKTEDKLDVYTKSDKVKEADTSKKEELDLDMVVHTNEDYKYSISVPSDWNEVLQDGYITYVHSPSASSIQIQTLNYDPSINNISSDTASTQVAEDGKTFMGFERENNSAYTITYQDKKTSVYDYIEKVYWDRNNIIKLKCTFNDENYEKIFPYFEQILASFSWEKSDEIPSEYYLHYNDAIGFEVGIPADWTVSDADGTMVAMNGDGNAVESISSVESETYLDKMTATDIGNMLKSDKANFIMQSYNNSKDSATAIYSYVADSVQYVGNTYLFADGEHIYFVTFEYQQESIDTSIPENCAKLFRAKSDLDALSKK